jgi:hypothetical protein
MKTLALLVTLALTAGCAAPGVPTVDEAASTAQLQKEIEESNARNADMDARIAESMGARFVEHNSDLPADTKRAILEGRLLVGMQPSEAQAAIGHIIYKVNESNGVGGNWSMWKSLDGDVFYLYFENARLVRWEQSRYR